VSNLDAWLIKMSGLWSSMLLANRKDIHECIDCGDSIDCRSRTQKRCDACRLIKKREGTRKRKHLFGNHRRRCRSYGVEFDRTITSTAVFERDEFRCQCCGRICLRKFRIVSGKPHLRSPTIGHITALCKRIKGHTWDNVQCECWSCNVSKGAESKGQHRLPTWIR
jgi:hypothetical protein